MEKKICGGKGDLTDIFKYSEQCHKRKPLESLDLFPIVPGEIMMTSEYKFLKLDLQMTNNGCLERKNFTVPRRVQA